MTATANVAVAVETPSDTTSAIVVDPVAWATGVMLIVRAAPAPPSMIPALATTAGLDEDAETISASGASNASATVKAIGPKV
jgi:hypothetical protein